MVTLQEGKARLGSSREHTNRSFGRGSRHLRTVEEIYEDETKRNMHTIPRYRIDERSDHERVVPSGQRGARVGTMHGRCYLAVVVHHTQLPIYLCDSEIIASSFS